MKKLTLAVFLVMAVITGGAKATFAGDGDAIGWAWQSHDRAVAGILVAWRSAAPHTDYGRSLQELASSEAVLLAYKVPATDRKFYSRLAENLPGNNPEVFAWKLFKERLGECGVSVGSPGTTLAYSSFVVRENATGRDGNVRF